MSASAVECLIRVHLWYEWTIEGCIKNERNDCKNVNNWLSRLLLNLIFLWRCSFQYLLVWDDSNSYIQVCTFSECKRKNEWMHCRMNEWTNERADEWSGVSAISAWLGNTCMHGWTGGEISEEIIVWSVNRHPLDVNTHLQETSLEDENTKQKIPTTIC